jgi:hypothetical protein
MICRRRVPELGNPAGHDEDSRSGKSRGSRGLVGRTVVGNQDLNATAVLVVLDGR